MKVRHSWGPSRSSLPYKTALMIGSPGLTSQAPPQSPACCLSPCLACVSPPLCSDQGARVAHYFWLLFPSPSLCCSCAQNHTLSKGGGGGQRVGISLVGKLVVFSSLLQSPRGPSRKFSANLARQKMVVLGPCGAGDLLPAQ